MSIFKYGTASEIVLIGAVFIASLVLAGLMLIVRSATRHRRNYRENVYEVYRDIDRASEALRNSHAEGKEYPSKQDERT